MSRFRAFIYILLTMLGLAIILEGASFIPSASKAQDAIAHSLTHHDKPVPGLGNSKEKPKIKPPKLTQADKEQIKFQDKILKEAQQHQASEELAPFASMEETLMPKGDKGSTPSAKDSERFLHHESKPKLNLGSDTLAPHKEEDEELVKKELIIPYGKEQYVEFHSNGALRRYISTKKLPRDSISLINSRWLYGSAIIESTFKDGNRRVGMGILLRGGLFLTSVELVYSAMRFSKNIYVKMRDDSANSLIYFARLHIQAVDIDSGLALLEINQFTDIYGRDREESFYQKRIIDKYYIDIFKEGGRALSSNARGDIELFYPKVGLMEGLDVDKSSIDKPISYYNTALKRSIKYGYAIGIDALSEHSFGRPYFNRQGDFIGLVGITSVDYMPLVINRKVIVNFVCEINESFTTSSDYISKSCAKTWQKKNYFATTSSSDSSQEASISRAHITPARLKGDAARTK